ncbi:hypothetical protein D3C77_544580 [compost metagenome]
MLRVACVRFWLRCNPRSSSLTIPATSPYTPTVIAMAMMDSTATWRVKSAPATAPRLMTMISADRMKSVRMAPLILLRSNATMSTAVS